MTIKHPPAHPSVLTPEYEYSADGKTVTFKNAGECLRAAQAGDEPMRAAFEAAYCKQYPVIAHISPDKFKRDEYGGYIEGAIFVGWDMYRAGQVSPRATADVERNLRAELVNSGALRQYCHNDGSAGFVTAYDFDITNRFLAAIATTKPGA